MTTFINVVLTIIQKSAVHNEDKDILKLKGTQVVSYRDYATEFCIFVFRIDTKTEAGHEVAPYD